MREIDGLRQDLAKTVRKLVDGEGEGDEKILGTARDVANNAGKYIDSIREELKYVGVRNEVPRIAGMHHE